MTFARRLAHVENIPQQDSAERAFNKLARAVAAQIEALKRHRSKGEQRMIVQHQHRNVAANIARVNVNTDGRRGTSNFSEDQPHEPKPKHFGHEPGTPLPSHIEADQKAMPRAGRRRV